MDFTPLYSHANVTRVGMSEPIAIAGEMDENCYIRLNLIGLIFDSM